MPDFEYVVRISRRKKGTRVVGQTVYTWFIQRRAVVQELVDLLVEKTPGGRPVEF